MRERLHTVKRLLIAVLPLVSRRATRRNFQGLRQYKEKFHPDRAPRYLASPGGLALPGVLAGDASLVRGDSAINVWPPGRGPAR